MPTTGKTSSRFVVRCVFRGAPGSLGRSSIILSRVAWYRSCTKLLAESELRNRGYKYRTKEMISALQESTHERGTPNPLCTCRPGVETVPAAAAAATPWRPGLGCPCARRRTLERMASAGKAANGSTLGDGGGFSQRLVRDTSAQPH